MNKILILAGPSAVGKTTVAKAILSSMDKFEYSKSATTREPRGDGHDSEYVYLSAAEFIKTAEAGDMLEYTEYAGNLYGTPKSEIDKIYESGKIPLLVLDLDGVDSVKTAGEYDSFAVYLYDDPNVLEERLYARYLGDAPRAYGLSKFVERKERNIAEFLKIDELAEGFDALIKNTDIKSTVDAILTAYNAKEAFDKSSGIAEVKALLDAKFNPKEQGTVSHSDFFNL